MAKHISKITCLLLWIHAGCGVESNPKSVGIVENPNATTPNLSTDHQTIKYDAPIQFVDVTAQSGINYRHVSGTNSEKATPTANGSGVAVLDYDNDGQMDLYFAQSTQIPVDPLSRNTGKLFRNLGANQFKDVTQESGLGEITYFTHGAIAADIDNDGDTDLYLCNFGKNALYLNQGGRFTNISTSSGTDYDGWSSSAAFLDYDADGLLDLYVSTYGDWKYPQDNRFCGDTKKMSGFIATPKRFALPLIFFIKI